MTTMKTGTETKGGKSMRVWIDGGTDGGGGQQGAGVTIRSSCQSWQQHWLSMQSHSGLS